MAGLTAGGGYEGPGRSPDCADAMVWAMTEIARPLPAEPRVLPVRGVSGRRGRPSPRRR
jgi:phage terminase large subunit-like protein